MRQSCKSQRVEATGCISVWRRVVNRTPHLLKPIAEESSANGNQVLCAGTTPTHTRPSEARTKLFAPALDHPGTCVPARASVPLPIGNPSSRNSKDDSPEKRVAQTRVFLRDGYNQVQEPM